MSTQNPGQSDQPQLIDKHAKPRDRIKKSLRTIRSKGQPRLNAERKFIQLTQGKEARKLKTLLLKEGLARQLTQLTDLERIGAHIPGHDRYLEYRSIDFKSEQTELNLLLLKIEKVKEKAAYVQLNNFLRRQEN